MDDMITGTARCHDYAGRNNGKPMLWPGDKVRSETLFLHRELAGLGFLATFAKEIGVSLDPDKVLGAAARLLHDYFRYSIAVFHLAEGFGGLTGYSPLDQAGCRRSWLNALKEYPELKYGDINGHGFMGLAAPETAGECFDHQIIIELPDRCGTIRLYCDGEAGELGTRRLLSGIGESLATALKNAREHDRVKELSLRDSLTGLYNRRVLEEILHLEENKRKPSPLAILILDVDDFKVINDSFGHPAGDHVLSEIGRLLLDNTRKENIVSRYGGEEFALLLTNTSLETALQIAERLRMKIGEQEFNFSGRKIRLSASFGVAHNEGHCALQESLISRADQALYKAKRSGKNRVCFHDAAHAPRAPEKRRRAPVRLGPVRYEGATVA
jgi:diguanylate cyclase (GGDEF)-like protein